MDWISFTYILFNFAVVGSITMFFTSAPLLMKQTYLVVTGVAVAFVFTWIPEWTTWVLLVAMAVYDVVAVLVPGGPLKMLVEMAEERDEDIPALVYEARRRVVRREDGVGGVVDEERQQEQQQQQHDDDDDDDDTTTITRDRSPSPGNVSTDGRSETPLLLVDGGGGGGGGLSMAEQHPCAPEEEEEAAAVVSAADGATGTVEAQLLSPPPSTAPPIILVEEEVVLAEEEEFALPEAIKLGLGDFIFYSVLVGRAAMYDMLTVFASYIAIISGLGCTLIWLAVTHHALPALPISIAFGVLFFFVSRYVLEPVVLPMTLRLVYF